MSRTVKITIESPSECKWRDVIKQIDCDGVKTFKIICKVNPKQRCEKPDEFPINCPLPETGVRKELKLTPENLIRHLEKSDVENNKKHLLNGVTPRIIYTTRDKKLGAEGEVFFVKGVGDFMLDSIEIFTPSNIWVCFAIEGFETPEEFLKELKRIYGEKLPDFLFLHKFKEIYLPEALA